jgi:hypothetical protein
MKSVRKINETIRGLNARYRILRSAHVTMKIRTLILLGTLLSAHMTASGAEPWHGPHSRDNDTTDLFKVTGKNAVWKAVSSVPMSWATFHTQGLVKIGDVFYVSAVEVLESTVKNGVETDALYDFSIDRSTGAGRGWLFKFDTTGKLLGKVELTNGTLYHPGGMDYDGRYIWVPVAEYRPNSQTRIYRVNPETLAAEHVFTAKDHIGGVVHNMHRGTLHGVSWGSRRLYTWALSRDGGRVKGSAKWEPNPEGYIDYQDCHYQGVEFMLCGGLNSYATPAGSVAFGGLELVDLRTNRPEHQVPVNLYVYEGAGPRANLVVTNNAFWVEPLGDGSSLRAYFMTETNNQANLLIYDATPWVNK